MYKHELENKFWKVTDVPFDETKMVLYFVQRSSQGRLHFFYLRDAINTRQVGALRLVDIASWERATNLEDVSRRDLEKEFCFLPKILHSLQRNKVSVECNVFSIWLEHVSFAHFARVTSDKSFSKGSRRSRHTGWWPFDTSCGRRPFDVRPCYPHPLRTVFHVLLRFRGCSWLVRKVVRRGNQKFDGQTRNEWYLKEYCGNRTEKVLSLNACNVVNFTNRRKSFCADIFQGFLPNWDVEVKILLYVVLTVRFIFFI